MASFGNFWKRSRSSCVENKRARRLFMESLESRNLLAAILTVEKYDNFGSDPPFGMNQAVRAGEQNLLYTVRITNSGNDDSTGITFVDNLPAHTSNGVLNVADAPAGSGAVVDQNPTTGDPRAIGKIALLHAGEHVDFSFQVAVDSNADLESVNPLHQIDNSVVVVDELGDAVVPGTGLDVAFHHFTATKTEADLAISKTADPVGPVHAGDSITYTIVVTNAGPSDSPPVAAGINMQDQVPTGISGLTVTSFVLTSYNGIGGPLQPTDWVKSGDTFTNTNAIPNGAVATFTMIVKVPDFASDGTVTN